MKFTLRVDRNQEEEVTATVHRENAFTARLEEMVRTYSGDDRLTAYGQDEIKVLSFSDVECIFLEGGKTRAVVHSGERFTLRARLYEIEEVMPQSFIRLSKSALANREKIERFQVSFSGAVDAVFQSGYRELVSRRCFTEMKRRFGIK